MREAEAEAEADVGSGTSPQSAPAGGYCEQPL